MSDWFPRRGQPAVFDVDVDHRPGSPAEGVPWEDEDNAGPDDAGSSVEAPDSAGASQRPSSEVPGPDPASGPGRDESEPRSVEEAETPVPLTDDPLPSPTPPPGPAGPVEPEPQPVVEASSASVPTDHLPPAPVEPVTPPPVQAEPTPSEQPPATTSPGSQRTLGPAASFPPRALPRSLAIANQKGGVGKTTTAVNLGAGLADLGYRVLVVDLDPQGNATTGLGINPRNVGSSVYEVLLADAAMEDCIEPTAVRNLFVVPATLDLAGAEIELVPAFSRELKLRRAVERLDGDFDFMLIDCPPSLGLLTVNGLAAVDEVLVPIQCEYYALEGLGQLLRNVGLVQNNLNPRLELTTIVLTMYDARTKLADQVAREVRAHFGPKVCRTIVPRTVRLSEAPSFGQPIIVFDPSSRGALAYRELAKEVSGGATRGSR